MSLGFVAQLMRTSVIQVLMMAAPVLLIGIVVGLIISIFQATTSIQDQTLTFVPKIFAILGSLIVFGPWIFGSIRNFTLNLFQMIPEMVR